MVVLDTLHTDPKVWGDDAHEYRYVHPIDGGEADE
jgi:hypothetical protein